MIQKSVTSWTLHMMRGALPDSLSFQWSTPVNACPVGEYKAVHFERFVRPVRLCGYAAERIVRPGVEGNVYGLAVELAMEGTLEIEADAGIAEQIRVFEDEGREPGEGVLITGCKVSIPRKGIVAETSVQRKSGPATPSERATMRDSGNHQLSTGWIGSHSFLNLNGPKTNGTM
jgi:hypothetical protein